jgi:hypothetical protein
VQDLDSYLNDHLAGSVGAIELIDHWAKIYEGKSLEKFFVDLKNEISRDQQTLRDLMKALDVKESIIRPAGAWIAEKLSRPKFGIAGDEPGGLGLFLALEALVVGITGKKFLWRALAVGNLPKIDKIDFAELEQRAETQIERVETERLRAAREALA